MENANTNSNATLLWVSNIIFKQMPHNIHKNFMLLDLWLLKYLSLFVVMTSFYSFPGPPPCSQQWHVNGRPGENCNETVAVSPQKPLNLRHFMSSFHISWVKRDILNYKSIYAPSRPSETVSKVLKHFLTSFHLNKKFFFAMSWTKFLLAFHADIMVVFKLKERPNWTIHMFFNCLKT